MPESREAEMARGSKTTALREESQISKLRRAMQGDNFCKKLTDEGDLWANAMVTVEPLRRGEDFRLEDVLTPEETTQRLKRHSIN